MAISPDLEPYLQLWPLDANPWQIRADSLAAAKLILGDEYDPLEPDLDVTLIEALARQTMDMIYAANRSVLVTLQGLLSMFGVPWNGGSQASTVLIFQGTPGTAIPVGLEGNVTLSTGETVRLVTTQAGEIASSGDLTLTAQVTAVGALPNRIAVGTPIQLAVSSRQIRSVKTLTPVSGGSDPESTEDYWGRCMNRMGRLTDSLAIPDHFTQFALEQTGVWRATTIDRWDGGNIATMGSHLGHVTVCVSDQEGNPLPSTMKEAIRTAMVERSISSISVHVEDAYTYPVVVEATIRRLPGADEASVIAGAQEALRTYFSAMRWKWGATVEPNDIVEILGRDVEGADVVVGAIEPSAPISLWPHELAVFDEANSVFTIVAP